jgi:hypothetical protein
VTFIRVKRAAKTNAPQTVRRSTSSKFVDQKFELDASVPTFALVACSKTKLTHRAAAKELYTSSLFRKSRAYVERHGWRWYILSALHGVVDPDAVLSPYDKSLAKSGTSERRAWSAHTVKQLESLIAPRANIVLLAGQSYSNFLVPLLLDKGHVVVNPLAGLGLGQRLKFLKGSLTASSRN